MGEKINDSVRQSLSKHFQKELYLTELPHQSPQQELLPFSAEFIDNTDDNESSFDTTAIHIDMTPRPLMATGPLIEALVRTNAGHYVDFRPLDALYQHCGSAGVQRVPASRGDVFQHRFVSAVEKRKLMRFVNWCVEGQPMSTMSTRSIAGVSSPSQVDDLSFHEAMTKMELSSKLRDFIEMSILFSTSIRPVSIVEGRSRVRRFHDSLARFSTRTPFLIPNYGFAELPQALCRLSAVHGGTYVLRRGVAGVVRDLASSCAIGIVTTDGDVVSTKHVFLSRYFVNCVPNPTDINLTWRLACVIDGSIMQLGLPGRVMLTFPKNIVGNVGSTVRIRQIDSSTSTCPTSLFVLYAETTDQGGSRDDLFACVQCLVRVSRKENLAENEDLIEKEEVKTTYMATKKPNLLWCITYSRNAEVVYNGPTFGSEIVCCPDVEHDTDGVFEEAERCFRTVFPNEPFLPDLRKEVDAELENSDAIN